MTAVSETQGHQPHHPEALKVAQASMAPEALRLQACVDAFFWSLRDAGLTVDMVEVVRFSDVEGDRAGDEYTGTNGHEAWQSMGKPMIGWDTHEATI